MPSLVYLEQHELLEQRPAEEVVARPAADAAHDGGRATALVPARRRAVIIVAAAVVVVVALARVVVVAAALARVVVVAAAVREALAERVRGPRHGRVGFAQRVEDLEMAWWVCKGWCVLTARVVTVACPPGS